MEQARGVIHAAPDTASFTHNWILGTGDADGRAQG